MDFIPYIAIVISLLTFLFNVAVYKRNNAKAEMDRINKTNIALYKGQQKIEKDLAVLNERIANEMQILDKLEQRIDELIKGHSNA